MESATVIATARKLDKEKPVHLRTGFFIKRLIKINKKSPQKICGDFYLLILDNPWLGDSFIIF